MPKARETCTECSRRRQKCDRKIPCRRCISRGDPTRCSREWPGGRYNHQEHRAYPRSQRDRRRRGEEEAAALHPPPPPPPPSSLSPSSPSRSAMSAMPFQRRHEGGSHASPGEPVPDVDNAASVLEFLSWGRSKLSDYHSGALELLEEPPRSVGAAGPECNVSNGFGGDPRTAQISYLQLLLPSCRQVFQLVGYHIDSILWFHACFHGPTFQRELEEACKGPAGLQVVDVDLRWLALLFSIMGASLTCATRQRVLSWGFQMKERKKLIREWYKATVSCLNLADYMWKHHIYSVEAITVSSMSAHTLGFTNAQRTLLGAAIKIAQGLGLQHLGEQNEMQIVPGATPDLEQQDIIIRCEVGRRLWGQLCIQDWVSIPFSEMYSIQKRHFETLKPGNHEEATMKLLPDDVPTSTSFPNLLFDIALLLSQQHDDIISSNTLITKYDVVMEYDTKIRKLITDTATKQFWVKDAMDPSWPPFVPWAQRGIATCAAHKIILIHRKFLVRSFSEPTFTYTRRACIDAAKAILKESLRPVDDDDDEPMLWVDQAFIVAAGVTLLLDIFHRKDTEPEYAEHYRLAQSAIKMLGHFQDSMVAERGVKLLSLLHSVRPPPQPRAAPSGSHGPQQQQDIDDADADADAEHRQTYHVMPTPTDSFTTSSIFTPPPREYDNQGYDVYNSIQDNAGLLGRRELAQQQSFSMFGRDLEAFEQLFPQYVDITNSSIFEDLLNFDL